MSDEKNAQEVNTEEQQSSAVNSQQSKEDYLLEQKRSANAEAKDWRVKFEALQQKVDDIEKTKNEAELNATEKLKARDQELVDLKVSIEKDKLTVQYIDAVKAKGFPDKVAKLGVPKDLSADNLLDSVKQFDKNYAEFKSKADEKPGTPATINPYVSVQPSTGPTKDLSELSPDELLEASLERSNKNKI